MATPLGTPIDIFMAVSRLRPGSEFHYMGGVLGVYADIGQWRDSQTTKPTEVEVYAEWDVYLTEKAAADSLRAQRLADFQEILGSKADTAITAITAEIAVLDGAPTNAQVIGILKANEQRQRALIKAFQHLLDVLS